MRQKKVKKIRKALKLKLPVKADMVVVKKKEIVATFFDKKTQKLVNLPSTRMVLVNRAKNQYRQIKKAFSRGISHV